MRVPNSSIADQHSAFDKLSYEVLTKDYTPAEKAVVGAATFGKGTARHIPVETLKKGAVMFHYFTIPERTIHDPQTGGSRRLTDDEYAKTVLGRILSQFGLFVMWSISQNAWAICISEKEVKPQFYYPNPAAGFAIDQTFNIGIMCASTRESRWAYMKSGTTVPDSILMHRGFTPGEEQDNYDYKRITNCSNVRLRSDCHPYWMADNDICLQPEFQATEKIDGITSIAHMDALLDIHDSPRKFNVSKDMFDVIRAWRAKIDSKRAGLSERDRDIDDLLWAMNLLCIESDKRKSVISVGFREFSNTCFGYKNADPLEFPPDPLPKKYKARSVYPNGTTRRAIYIPHEHMAEFVAEYISPHMLMKPVALNTQHGTYSPFHPVETLSVPPEVIRQDQTISSDTMIYQFNHAIGEDIMAHIDKFQYDLIDNIFYLTNEAHHTDVPIRSLSIKSAFPSTATFSGYRDEMHETYGPVAVMDTTKRSHFMRPLTMFRELPKIKLMKDAYTYAKKGSYIFHEFNDPMTNTTIPISPYHIPLSFEDDNIAGYLGHYYEILKRLERGVNSPGLSTYLRDVSDTIAEVVVHPVSPTITVGGRTVPYHVGIIGDNLHVDENTVEYNSETTNSSPEPKATTMDDLDKLLAQLGVGPTFGGIKNQMGGRIREPLITTVAPSNSVTILPSKPKTTPTPKQNQTTQTTRTTQTAVPSVSSTVAPKKQVGEKTIEPLTADQYYILDYMMKDTSLSPILKLLFVNVDEFTSKKGTPAKGGRRPRTRRNRKGRKQTRRRRV